MANWNIGSPLGPSVRFHCDKCGQDYGVGEKCRCALEPKYCVNCSGVIGEAAVNYQYMKCACPKEVDKIAEVDYRRNKRILDLELENKRLIKVNFSLANNNLIVAERMEQIRKALLEKKGMTIEELLKEDEKVENQTRFQLLEVDDD